jgi:hypothetical protein
MYKNLKNSFRYINPNKAKLITVLAFSMLMPLPAWSQATTSIDVPIAKFNVEGGEKVPVKGEAVTVDYKGKSYSGVKFNMQNWATNNAIRIPLTIDASIYNTIEFKVRYSSNIELANGSSLMIIDTKGNWDSTRIGKVSKKLEDGWYQVSWDVINQPDNVKGANLKDLKGLYFGYPLKTIPEGQTLEMTVVDMKFVSGKSFPSGDPKLYKEWRQYIDTYSPDYSDSSKHLQPPTTGRITAPISLVKNGKAQGGISVPANATGPLQLASSELKHWLKEITGADFTISPTNPAGNQPQILLGSQYAAGKFDADLAALKNTDGFAVRTQGNQIYIFGATEKGTLNGVFRFLENNTDIIWARPRKEFGTIHGNTPNLDIVWANDRIIPATRLRGWSTNLGLRPFHEIWANRNGGNYPKGGGGVKSDLEQRTSAGNYVEFGGGHNISGFLGDNPAQFYPTIDGAVPEKFNIWKHQPNFTAPGLAETVATSVLKYINEKGPKHLDCININIEDNWGLSTDAKSLEPIKLPDGTMLPSTDETFRSTQYFLFLNDVARRIKKERPGLMVGTYAYFFTAVPPKIKLEDNIRVYFCPYVRKDQRTPLYSPINDVWWTRLNLWAKATPNVVIREYYGILNGFRPLAEVVAADVTAYSKLGVKEYTAELNPDEQMFTSDNMMRGGGDEWDFMAMEFWVIQRLYWDPTQDVEQLRKYYLRRTYREAAPAMEKFFGTIRANWYKQTVPSDFDDPKNLMRTLVIRAGAEESLRSTLKEALTLAKHPSTKVNIGAVKNRYEEWLESAKPEAAKVSDEIKQQRLRDNIVNFSWGPSNFWGNNAAATSATYLLENGKNIHAIAINIDPSFGVKPQYQIINSMIKTLGNGSTLSFKLRPAVANAPIPEISLIATDKNNVTLTSTKEAIKKLADGTVQVDFVLQSPDDATKKLDAKEMKSIQINLSSESIPTDRISTFFMTDVELKAPANQANTLVANAQLDHVCSQDWRCFGHVPLFTKGLVNRAIKWTENYL